MIPAAGFAAQSILKRRDIMPMLEPFSQRLFPKLPDIAERFGTPFHVYDEQGILETGEEWKRLFSNVHGFQEFFAVKALPNPEILKLMRKMGFGFDCSSVPELILARQVGASSDDIMFTSNNTGPAEFAEAFKDGGCILNLDDIALIDKVPDSHFLKRICFRYNPGERRSGNEIIGNPVESKYGVRDDQIIAAYARAIDRGAGQFGIHTMICSNERDYTYMGETVRMLLEVVERISQALGIRFEFINIGGGIGIPYRPDDEPFDISGLAQEAGDALAQFRSRHGHVPKLFLESGRAMTGPHGVLVTKVLNRMSKYREYVGVDACMSSLMRPAMYGASGSSIMSAKLAVPKGTLANVSGGLMSCPSQA